MQPAIRDIVTLRAWHGRTRTLILYVGEGVCQSGM